MSKQEWAFMFAVLLVTLAMIVAVSFAVYVSSKNAQELELAKLKQPISCRCGEPK